MSDTAPKNNINNAVLDIEVSLSACLGNTKLKLNEVINLNIGNIIGFGESSANDPVQLIANDKPITKGEIVVVDGYWGFRVRRK